MPQAKGKRLSDWQGTRLGRAGPGMHEVFEVYRRLGQVLQQFHNRYNRQLNHADFTPANVHYDDVTKQFTLVDLGGLGTNVTEGDLEHFCNSINIMGVHYGAQYVQQGQQALKQGYGPDTSP